MSMPISQHVKELLRLAAPVIVSRTGVMTMVVVGVAFLGRVGPEQVAYMAIAGVAVGTIIIGTVGLMVGTMVETAHALGAGKDRECGQVWRRSLLYALVVGLVGAGICQLGEPFFLLMGQSPDIAAGGGRVLAVMGWSLPGAALYVTTTFFLEAIKRPEPGMVTILFANLLNAFLNWVFVLGNLGMPAMGAVGSGLAITITRVAMAIGLMSYVLLMGHHDRFGVRLRPKHPWRDGATARGIGYASGASYGLEAAAFGSMSIFAGWLGALPLAAWSISLNASSMAFMTAVGLGVGTAVRVGHARGRGDRAEMAVAGWVGLGVCMAVMAVASVVFVTLSPQLAAIFTNDPALASLAATMIALTAWFMIADGGQGVMLTAVRGTGDTWIPTVMHFTAYFGVMIPSAWLLTFPLGLGAPGLFLAILLASIVALGLLSWRFWQRCRSVPTA